MTERPTSLPVHTRTIVVDAYDEVDSLVIIGRLSDRRPDEGRPPALVHDMQLVIRVELETNAIVEADARMRTFPHAECPAIAPAFEQLVGLRIGPGFNREVSRLFVGPAGCTHLDQLARIVGPVVVQARGSLMMRAIERGEEDPPEQIDSFTRDSCHVWRTRGPGEQKMALGWRTGPRLGTAPDLRSFLDETCKPPA